MMDMMNGGHGWAMNGMWFFSILFWVLIITGIVLVTKWFLDRNRNEGAGFKKETALEMLEKRYVKGEIDRETFEQMKKDIGS